MFNSEEYVTKINIELNNNNNNDYKLKNVIDILIKCNNKRRKEINDKYNNLEDKFKEYTSNKNLLNILNLMLNSSNDCDAIWIYNAINTKDDNTIIEILLTGTNSQILLLKKSYKMIFDNNLKDDIYSLYFKTNNTFYLYIFSICMCFWFKLIDFI